MFVLNARKIFTIKILAQILQYWKTEKVNNFDIATQVHGS